MKTRMPFFRGTDIVTLAKVVFYSVIIITLAYLLAVGFLSEVGMK